MCDNNATSLVTTFYGKSQAANNQVSFALSWNKIPSVVFTVGLIHGLVRVEDIKASHTPSSYSELALVMHCNNFRAVQNYTGICILRVERTLSIILRTCVVTCLWRLKTLTQRSCLLSLRSPLWKTVSAEDREMCLSVADDGEFW